MTSEINKSEISGRPLSFFHALFGRCTAFYGHFLVHVGTSEWSTRISSSQGISDFVGKVARNPLGKTIAKKDLEYAPDFYQNLTKRVINKTLKRILNSGAAHSCVGEMYFWCKDWCKHDSSDFDKDKSIPFIKLLSDLVGDWAVYYLNQTRMGRYENYPLLAKNIKKAGQLKCLYNKIKKLSDELFCTGDIQTIDDCLEVYRQYVNNESFDPFLYNDWEKKRSKFAPIATHFLTTTICV